MVGCITLSAFEFLSIYFSVEFFDKEENSVRLFTSTEYFNVPILCRLEA
jgi:hypothetical protein